VQNEPTPEKSAASTAPAEGSDARAAQTTPPNPEEMAKLRKLTDLLSRCRPRDDEPQDDPEADMS